jgi:hypothetical protein
VRHCAAGVWQPLCNVVFLPDFPDPALRQPATLAAVTPAFLTIYAQAVLAILSNTFILKLSLLPFIVWQAWSCAVGLSVSTELQVARVWKQRVAQVLGCPLYGGYNFLYLKEK